MHVLRIALTYESTILKNFKTFGIFRAHLKRPTFFFELHFGVDVRNMKADY